MTNTPANANGVDVHANVTALFSMFIVTPSPDLLSRITNILGGYLEHRQTTPAVRIEAGTGPRVGAFESPSSILCRKIDAEDAALAAKRTHKPWQ